MKKNLLVTFLTLTGFLFSINAIAQQREIKQKNNVVKSTHQEDADGRVKLTTVHVKKEQKLMNATKTDFNNPQVISSGYMEGTPNVKVTTSPKLTEETCKVLISAMEKKVEWVRNNPEEDNKAKKSGWYKQTKKEIKKLKKQLKELEKIK